MTRPKLTTPDTNKVPLARRDFLRALGGLALVPALSTSPLAETLLAQDSRADQLFASAFKGGDGRYGIGIVNDYGEVLARIAVPGRGHGVAFSPKQGCLVAFARRPGTVFVTAHPFASASVQVTSAPAGRHFYGHGCFSADGRLLYCAENAFETGDGVIGVYDMSGRVPFRIGEFFSHGIGPHEILAGADGRTLIIANGGIRTHPDHGRAKLNLETMAPSIAYLEMDTGDLSVRHRLDHSLHQLSLRHMTLDSEGRVWVGGQFEGAQDQTPPLVAMFSKDQEPKTLEIGGPKVGDLQNYIGSVAANADRSVIATSAPRGGKTLLWDAAAGTLIGTRRVVDGCGAAPIDAHGFLISDGNGGLSLVADPDAPSEVLARPAGIAWDNHLTRLG